MSFCFKISFFFLIFPFFIYAQNQIVTKNTNKSNKTSIKTVQIVDTVYTEEVVYEYDTLRVYDTLFVSDSLRLDSISCTEISDVSITQLDISITSPQHIDVSITSVIIDIFPKIKFFYGFSFSKAKMSIPYNLDYRYSNTFKKYGIEIGFQKGKHQLFTGLQFVPVTQDRVFPNTLLTKTDTFFIFSQEWKIKTDTIDSYYIITNKDTSWHFVTKTDSTYITHSTTTYNVDTIENLQYKTIRERYLNYSIPLCYGYEFATYRSLVFGFYTGIISYFTQNKFTYFKNKNYWQVKESKHRFTGAKLYLSISFRFSILSDLAWVLQPYAAIHLYSHETNYSLPPKNFYGLKSSIYFFF